MNRIEKQKMGMQQNNHSDKEVLETTNQTPNRIKKHKTHNTISQIKTQKPKTNKKHVENWCGVSDLEIILVHPVLKVSDPNGADLVGAGGLGLGLSLVVEVVLCWCLRGPHLSWGLNCRTGRACGGIIM